MTAPLYYSQMPSPIGTLTLLASGRGLTGVFMEAHATILRDEWIADDAPFAEVRMQLDSYFAGRLRTFDLALDWQQGTPFQRRVWQALLEIPFGETISYGEQARRIGNPLGVRAVGLANGRNPFSIIVPCHRVIGKNGTLTGYGGGLERKRFLLDLEKSHLQAATA
ncbi:MAG: methylated-DNA--[protein]-cysteine S-methyltransferase [Chthoniobacterales bacterium]